MINRRTINNALRAKGYRDEIFAGNGYWYFSGNDASQFTQSGVYGVYRLNELTLTQWIAAYESLRASSQL
jgi:hypothetical protein